MLDKLFATYPSGNITPEDFINALTPGADHFGATLFAVLMTFFLGFMVYVYSIILVNREGKGPYPLWMHTFYCAADFMGIWVFLSEYLNYGHFWFFLLGCVGEAAWVVVEIYCLYKSVTVEREDLFEKGATVQSAALTCVLQWLVFFVSLNLLRVELGDNTMYKFWIFTQVIICAAPGFFWKKRGTRLGACWQLNIVLILVAIMSFNPWNMWAMIAPEYFSVSANPWYYAVGVVTLLLAIRGCLIYKGFDKKPAVLANGKKPVF